MSFAIGYVEPVRYKEQDPTALDTVLEALRGTSKGKLKYPEPLLPPSDVCDVKHVGDLSHILNSESFRDEISFSENYNCIATPIFAEESDKPYDNYWEKDTSDVYRETYSPEPFFRQDWEPHDTHKWTSYRATNTSPLRSPNHVLGFGEDAHPATSDAAHEDASDKHREEPVPHAVDNLLARMQIDTSTSAIAERVKRYRQTYIDRLAAIHSYTVSELKSCQQKAIEEDQLRNEKNKRELEEIKAAIDHHTTALLASKESEAEQRKATLLSELAEEAERQHQLELEKEHEQEEQIKKQQRDELLESLKESYTQFSVALDQMLKEINQCGGVELPPESDEQLNRTLKECTEVISAAEPDVSTLQQTAQKVKSSITYVHQIRDILDARKQAKSTPATPSAAPNTSSSATITAEGSVSHSSTALCLAHLNPSAQAAVIEAKQTFMHLSNLFKNVHEMANMLSTQDTAMRSKLSRALACANQFNNDASSNRQKLHQLINLLTGSLCNAGGVEVSIADRQGAASMFVREQLASKLVSLAHDKQVNSQAVYGSLMVQLWKVDPLIKDLSLYHLYKTCPYLVPQLSIREEFASTDEFYKALGYRLKDGGEREAFDVYLKRMGSAAQLYGRLVAVEGSPLTLEHGWQWLSRLVLLPAQSAVTCSVLYGFLSTAGALLLNTYGRQFQKVLNFLHSEFLPLLEQATLEGGEADLASVKTFFENYSKTGTIAPPPEGYRSLL